MEGGIAVQSKGGDGKGTVLCCGCGRRGGEGSVKARRGGREDAGGGRMGVMSHHITSHHVGSDHNRRLACMGGLLDCAD